jgi:glycosyltransferase involved in cell wall biosynthesis
MVSVIIPCFNCAAFITRAVDSVVNQTFKDWELILVDNNSTDETPEMLIQFQKRFPEKTRVFYEEKPGAPCARNKGLSEAKGDWIQFLDADDEISPDKLESQYALALQTNPNFIAGTYKKLGTYMGAEVNVTRAVGEGDIWSALIKSDLGITSANLWRRKTLQEVNGWDESLVASQEYDVMFRILKISTAVELDPRNTTTIHIVPGESISRGSGKEKALRVLESKINLRRRIKAHLAEHNLLTAERKRLVDRYLFEYLTKTYRYTHDNSDELQGLDVPITSKFMSYIFRRKMDLKRILKRGEVEIAKS